MTNHRSEALQHVAAVHAAREHLEALYRSPHADRAQIAELHQQVGTGLKLADIHATLSVTDALRDLAAVGPLSGVR